VSDVLAVAPHADDIELSAGGTIAMLSASGHDVVFLDLTRGEKATRGTPEKREKESRAAAAVLGARRECAGLPDAGVSANDPEHLAKLVEAIRVHRPRLLIAMHWNDDHPDHIEGGELVRRGVYLAGLRNYPAPDREPHRPRRTLFAMGRRPFDVKFVVDVTRYYETKRRALAEYVSQFRRDPDDPLVTPISDPEFLNHVEARDRYFGGLIGATFGEPFFEIGPSAVDSASTLIPGESS
jgi:bacillithiol biosynthesis deacetylase BshB1